MLLCGHNCIVWNLYLFQSYYLCNKKTQTRYILTALNIFYTGNNNNIFADQNNTATTKNEKKIFSFHQKSDYIILSYTQQYLVLVLEIYKYKGSKQYTILYECIFLFPISWFPYIGQLWITAYSITTTFCGDKLWYSRWLNKSPHRLSRESRASRVGAECW